MAEQDNGENNSESDKKETSFENLKRQMEKNPCKRPFLGRIIPQPYNFNQKPQTRFPRSFGAHH